MHMYNDYILYSIGDLVSELGGSQHLVLADIRSKNQITLSYLLQSV